MSAVTPNTFPWAKYFCNDSTGCPVEGFSCHYNKYCIPTDMGGKNCKDENDVVAPFVARVNNTYTLYCDMPKSIEIQTNSPAGCESWEDYHGGVCMVKKCTTIQSGCKAKNYEMCGVLGVKSEEVFCYESTPHGNSNGVKAAEETGLSSSQIGGIAGGVSAAVVVLLAAGAFFFVRRRRAAKAAKANGSNQSLPTYSAQDEKNAMKQVTSV
ncbi:hypothetical protein BGZ51_003040 [Haplosporangium sp. Z 767]|nr:hypothetical protein BGZ50_005227 [Haplosporangium sp. Z 11]KAF9184917.1 hypothetical protein BGZ51_003040 [Haplosporangium sp. Z 767]